MTCSISGSEDIERVIAAFAAVGRELGVVK